MEYQIGGGKSYLFSAIQSGVLFSIPNVDPNAVFMKVYDGESKIFGCLGLKSGIIERISVGTKVVIVEPKTPIVFIKKD